MDEVGIHELLKLEEIEDCLELDTTEDEDCLGRTLDNWMQPISTL